MMWTGYFHSTLMRIPINLKLMKYKSKRRIMTKETCSMLVVTKPMIV